MVGDREDARAYGPLLDPLWRSLLRLTPGPRTTSPTPGSAMPGRTNRAGAGRESVLPQVLSQVAAARRTYDPRRQ